MCLGDYRVKPKCGKRQVVRCHKKRNFFAREFSMQCKEVLREKQSLLAKDGRRVHSGPNSTGRVCTAT